MLIFSNNIADNFKHLKTFNRPSRKNGFIIPAPRIKLDFFAITLSMLLSLQYINEITDINQLQRFLESLNYSANFYKELASYAVILYEKLKKNSSLKLRRIPTQ